MHINLLNDKEFGSFKFFNSKYRREGPLIQQLGRIGSTQEIRSPILTLRKFWKLEKRTGEWCRMHWNLMNDAEFPSFKFLNLKFRTGDQIILPFCRIGFPQEIKSPLLNLRKFWKSEKKTAESCRMHWNLVNDKEFGSFKFFNLKNSRVGWRGRPTNPAVWQNWFYLRN